MMSTCMKIKFLKRFRMTYNEWKNPVEKLKKHDIFVRWKRGFESAIGKPCSPIELHILVALKNLERNSTFDDLEENTFISEKVH